MAAAAGLTRSRVFLVFQALYGRIDFAISESDVQSVACCELRHARDMHKARRHWHNPAYDRIASSEYCQRTDSFQASCRLA